MDQRSYESAKQAYQQGDFARCAATLQAARIPGEPSGAADHLRGNALMKMGLYSDAARAYSDALADPEYGKVGALSCNRGRALMAVGDLNGAVESLTRAAQDPDYPTPYKAYMALGNAQMALGDPREAGIAFRNAAIDEANPDPAGALTNLGQCFLELGRPVDAVEAYRTALDFSTPAESQNAIWASLGRAYVAANRMSEAQDAFSHATADGSYRLTPAEQTASLAASNAMASLQVGPSETDRMLAEAGYGIGAYDPLDPTGASGVLMPSPEDTGFFSVSESDIVRQDRALHRHRHVGLKVFLILLIMALVALGGAFWMGLGWPMQEVTVANAFAARTAGEDLSKVLASSVSEQSKNDIAASIPMDAKVKIDGVDRSLSNSKVVATAQLADGGSQSFVFTLVREGLGWKIVSVDLSFNSQDAVTPEGAASQAAPSEAPDAAAPAEGEAAPADAAAVPAEGEASAQA